MSESLRVDHGFGKIITRDLDSSPVKMLKNAYQMSKKDSADSDQGAIIEAPPGQLENEDVVLDPKLLAKIKIKLEGEVVISGRYKTLFSGLKKNQERNSQILHPIAFLTRRLVFIASVLLFVN